MTILLILGGTVFGVLGACIPSILCSIYGIHDGLSQPILRLRGRWRTRLLGYRAGAPICGELGLGFNFSHSLWCSAVCRAGVLGWVSIQHAPVGVIMPVLTLIGCVYLVLALLYWFRVPAIGVAIGTSCFAAAWVLSLMA